MKHKRVPLYERLPEIYRIKDAEQEPPFQLKHYLALVENIFGAVHENIESLYENLFIETCENWVVPYIGDLLGTTRLDGDPWTQRADVAGTIAFHRRKGTLAGLLQLAFNLTQWGVHLVELRESLLWNQHLNHQRPDAFGKPPYRSSPSGFIAPRGGLPPVRDPALLSLLGTPFDPFAHMADLKPPDHGNIRYNIPNLAVFLWRLKDYRVRLAKPRYRATTSDGTLWFVRFDIHPRGQPLVLFNTFDFDPDREPPVLTELDRTPGPIAMARLNQSSRAGAPEFYLEVTDLSGQADVALQIHLPKASGGQPWPSWHIRGENLCAWEPGVRPPLQKGDIAVDPRIGRLVLAVDDPNDAAALQTKMLVTHTHGAVGPVGAVPMSRAAAPTTLQGEPVDLKIVPQKLTLTQAIQAAHQAPAPVVIEIRDSLTHIWDRANALRLKKPLIIRAAANQRPIIEVREPMKFRPDDVTQAHNLWVRLEGLYLTSTKALAAADKPIIGGATLNRLEIVNCTLDPGGYRALDGVRAAIKPALGLPFPYELDAGEEEDFDQIPEIILYRTISGPLAIDPNYTLSLTDTILDAGGNVGEPPPDWFALSSLSSPDTGYGPPTRVNGVTLFGSMRVAGIDGRGGIWVHPLVVLDNQRGCLRQSYFPASGNRLPQNLGSVRGDEAPLCFVSEIFGEPAYGQLAHNSDFRILERGPNDAQMGVFGFLREAQKWHNLRIRFRESMPVDIRPLYIPVT